jgi:hypothetical protein
VGETCLAPTPNANHPVQSRITYDVTARLFVLATLERVNLELTLTSFLLLFHYGA